MNGLKLGIYVDNFVHLNPKNNKYTNFNKYDLNSFSIIKNQFKENQKYIITSNYDDIFYSKNEFLNGKKWIEILLSSGNWKLGKKSKTIRINYNELQHQDLLIKWIFHHNHIISYETERELKSYDYLEQNKSKKRNIKKGYPNLIVHFENKDMIVELERTRKSKERFESKLDSYYREIYKMEKKYYDLYQMKTWKNLLMSKSKFTTEK